MGHVNGEFIINPTPSELEVSDLDLTVAGTKDAINMVEAGAKQVSEDLMLEALMFGHEAIKELVNFQEEIISEIGVEKMDYETLEIEDSLKEEVRSLAEARLNEALRIPGKQEQYEVIDLVKEEIVEKYTKENDGFATD